MKKSTKKVIAILSGLLLSVFCLLPQLSLTADARGMISATELPLKLKYQYDDLLLQGVTVRAYQVASMDQYGNVKLLDELKDLPVTGLSTDADEDGQESSESTKNSLADAIDVNSIKDVSEWNVIKNSVAGYLISEDYKGTYYSATSDENGIATFDSLPIGVYFISADSLEVDNVGESRNNADGNSIDTYTFASFLTSVPAYDADTDEWIEDRTDTVDNGYATEDGTVIRQAKVEKASRVPTGYSVIKRWVGTGSIAIPREITFNIYRDNELFAKNVSLSEANNWNYEWLDKETGHNWYIAEATDSGYTMTLVQNGTSFVLTNSYDPGNPPETPPGDTPPGDTPPGTPNTPDGEVLGANRTPGGDGPAVLGARRLPQTGQLWWPVPILAAAGLVLVAVGYRMDRKKKNVINS